MSERAFTAFRMFTEEGKELTVSLPLDCDGARAFDDADAQSIRAAIETMKRNGFTINAPGANEGEIVREVGYVCRRAKINDDGSETPLIDLYPDTDNPKVVYKTFSLYLNTDEDVAAFEAATGVRLESLPLYDSNTALKRDDRKSDKYVVALTRKPVRVALTHNPLYNPDETDVNKKKPQFRFARWLDTSPNAPSQREPGKNEPSSGASASHWTTSDIAKQKVSDALNRLNINGRDRIAAVIAAVEPGITALSQSKTANEDEFIARLERYVKTLKGGVDDEDQIPF